MAVWNFKKPQFAQPAQEVTADNPAVSHINHLIAEENDKLEKHYLMIGKKYTQLHAADYEEEFAEYMKSIAASQKKLSDYSLQMQIVTGVVVCTNCHNNAPKGSVFCNMCGSRLPVINYDDYEMCENCGILMEKGLDACPGCGHRKQDMTELLLHCTKCGEYISSDNRFCPVCGEPLGRSVSMEKPAKHRCPNPSCGAVMSPDMLFCTECGTRLR